MKKGIKVLVVIICLLLISLVVVILYENKLIFKEGIDIDNIIDKKNSEDKKYKLVKVLDYSENEDNKNGTNIIETDKYYILEYLVDYNRKTILYDKKGNNVTEKVFGVNNIASIDGILYNNNYERYIVRTEDDKYGLYDKDFNEIVKIDNYVIERTSDVNYFLVGDGLKEPSITDWLENVGVYDKNGKLIIPRDYERINLGGMYNGSAYYDTDDVLFYARKDNKYGILDKNNKIVIPFMYDRENTKVTLGLGEVFKNNNKQYYILYKDGKYGMVDKDNKVIIDFNKGKLFYNEYSNTVIEQVYNDRNIDKVNVYDLLGKKVKEIDLSDKMKADFYAYYNNIKSHFVLYDDENIYVLNNKLEYDKYIKPANIEMHWSTNYYLVGDSIYLKESNDKYKIYNIKDNSLYSEDDYYLRNSEVGTNSKYFVLCKNKLENEYDNCGVIGYDGKIILDFKYRTMYSSLEDENEFIDFEYNQDKKTYEINKTKVNGKCVIDNKEYFVRNKIIQINNEIYDTNCNKIASDVTNYDILDENLVMTEKFEDRAYNTYKIYDIRNKELAEIDGLDDIIITNNIRTDNVSDLLIMTNKGVYKIESN